MSQGLTNFHSLDSVLMENQWNRGLFDFLNCFGFAYHILIHVSRDDEIIKIYTNSLIYTFAMAISNFTDTFIRAQKERTMRNRTAEAERKVSAAYESMIFSLESR